MKLNCTILSCLTMTCFANAKFSTIPGGISEKNLVCVTSQPMFGVTYGLKIKTQTLAMEFNIKGGEFTKIGVYPDSIPLELIKQTPKFAFFELENSYSIILDKNNYNAEIKRGDLVYFKCSEKK
jgi:hypothetical protein